MTRRLSAFVLVFFAIFNAAPSRADIDQHCLALCKNNGGTSTACLAHCTYNQSDANSSSSASGPAPPDIGVGAGVHKQFDAPVPSNDLILAKPNPIGTAEPGKDYRCVTQCMQNGGQYQMCNQNCVKQNCAAGSSQCKDLLGVAPGSILTPPAGVSVGTAPSYLPPH